MDKKFEGKPVVRDIEICRKCSCFRGQIGKMVMTSKEFTVTEEEFVRATKYYAYKNECLQPEK